MAHKLVNAIKFMNIAVTLQNSIYNWANFIGLQQLWKYARWLIPERK